MFTLVYLALQIRQNTNQLNGAAVQASILEFNDLRATQLASRDVAELWVKGARDSSSLDDVDRFRFTQGFHSYLGVIFALDRRIRFGTFEEYDDPFVDELLEKTRGSPGFRTVWLGIKLGYPKGFQQKVENAIEKAVGTKET